MKSLLNAVLAGIIIGFVVSIICYIVGAVPHLTFLRTYSEGIGVVAGIIVFVNRWDFTF